jgi:translocation and assembly module TamB
MDTLNRESTQLPPLPRRRPRRDWGRLFARMLCAIFMIVGLFPIAAALVVRSAWARTWATDETRRILRDKDITATYSLEVRLWPLGVELGGLTVAATDGGSPALETKRVSLRPRFFPLLSGKLAIDQIEVDAPRVRLVVHHGKVQNLKLPESGQNKDSGPIHAPSGVFSISDASLDLDLEGSRLKAGEVDVDLTVDDAPQGAIFEMKVHADGATFKRSRLVYPRGSDEPVLAIDDDALCSIDARVHVEPDHVLLRRLSAMGSADLDIADNTTPRCDLPEGDRQRVELDVSNLNVRFPEKKGEMPRIEGHARVRVPVGIAERLASLPETDGWIAVDADVRFAEDTPLPEASGHFEAHDIHLDQYSFAREIQTDFTFRRNVVASPRLMIKIADGTGTMNDITVDLSKPGFPVKIAKGDITDVNFTSLMHDLGISKHPHVAWDLHEVHVQNFKGTIVPLKMDGDLQAKTAGFGVFDAPVDAPSKTRIIGAKEAGLVGRVQIRPDALQFTQVSARLPASHVDGLFVSIGFHNDLRVDVPKGTIDLTEIGPLGSLPIAGVAEVEAHVTGIFTDPHLEADASIQKFVLGDIPFGDVTAGHATLNGLVVDLKGVKAQKNKSSYEMPTARLDFGPPSHLTMDAIAVANAMGVQDFFGLWHLDEDPRFDKTQIDGSLATRANIHLALGGPEDVCGDGFIDVRATAHVKDVLLYGERFEDGDLDLEYKWTDRRAGIEGADVDVRAVTLHKGRTSAGAAVGSLLGSASIQRGGALNGSVVLESLPLARIDQFGAAARDLEGSASGIVKVHGTVDAYTAEGDVDVSPARFRGAQLGSSHVHLAMTQLPSSVAPIGRTEICKGRIFPPFNKEAYKSDSSLQGEYRLDGDLFGGQVHLDGVRMTRQKSPELFGKIGLRKADLGAVTTMLTSNAEKRREAREGDAPLGGEISGDLTIERVSFDQPALSKVRFAPASLSIERGGQKLSLRPNAPLITLENDTLSVPALAFDLSAKNGLKGAFTLKGSVGRVTSEADLALVAELEPIDLGLLVGIVPKLERSQGTLTGSVKLGGRASAPALDGTLSVRGGELAIHQFPSVITDIDVDVAADSSEVRVTRASAKFAGGTIAATATMPLRGDSFGRWDANVTARGIHVTSIDGVQAAFDADIVLSQDTQAAGGPQDRLPHASGDVLITSFEYTRPITLATDLNAIGGRATRTKVESYDPSLDNIVLDLRVRSRVPLKIRNNLVEVSLGIDSGALAVSGTDQRIGLRGELKANPGGRFHFRANDFDIKQALIRFDDPTRIDPKVDVLATTEYRRYTDTGTTAAAGASGGSAAATAGSGRTGGLWRISLHAYGNADNMTLDMTSDPALAQDDIVLLLTIGMTRAEADQLSLIGASGASLALDALATVSGADRAVKNAVPVIDDFRFGSAYSSRSGRTDPQVTVGKRLTEGVRANVSTGLTEDREVRANVEWRLNQRLSVQGSYDNINDVSSSTAGNLGVDLRWRLEFE